MKFSTHDCPACQEMAGFDAAVAAGLGFSFDDIDMKNIESYRVDRKYLLYRRSARRTIALPTYILVDLHGDDFAFHGELTGSMLRDRFRASLEGMQQQSEFARSVEDA